MPAQILHDANHWDQDGGIEPERDAQPQRSVGRRARRIFGEVAVIAAGCVLIGAMMAPSAGGKGPTRMGQFLDPLLGGPQVIPVTYKDFDQTAKGETEKAEQTAVLLTSLSELSAVEPLPQP